MKIKKFWSAILIGTLVAHTCCLPAVAAEKGNTEEIFIVDQRGEYVLAIRNRSFVEISVSGYVIY